MNSSSVAEMKHKDKGHVRLSFQRNAVLMVWKTGGRAGGEGRTRMLVHHAASLLGKQRGNRKRSQSTKVCFRIGLCLLKFYKLLKQHLWLGTMCSNKCLSRSLHPKPQNLRAPCTFICHKDPGSVVSWNLSKNMQRKEFACGQDMTYVEKWLQPAF